MGLHGQAAVRQEEGYAMAALLVMLAVMLVLMTVAMPVWRQQARREKEAELVFRGEQYARAIALFRRRNAQNPNALPPSIDVLIEGRFLRKKYKDPMTKDGEWVLIPMGAQQQPGQPQTPTPTNPSRGNTPPPVNPQIPGSAQAPGSGQRGGAPLVGGIAGVRSKSTETSLRSYRGATRYDQMAFLYSNAPTSGGALPLGNSPEGGQPSTNQPGSNVNQPGRRGGRSGQDGRPGTMTPPGSSFPTTQPPAGGGRPGGSGRRGGGGQ